MTGTLLASLLLASSAFCAGPEDPVVPTSAEERVKIDAVRKLRAKDDPANVEQLAAALAGEPSAAVRRELLRTLASGRHVGTRALRAVASAMSGDLDHLARREAAVLSLAFPGGAPLEAGDLFLLEEANPESRAAYCLAAATASAHAADPELTRILARTLLEDAEPPARLAAARALARRGDRRALTAATTAAQKDADESVRREAAAAVRALAKVPRVAPKPVRKTEPPRPRAVKGKDECPAPNGWCECSNGPILKAPARCMPLEDCEYAYENTYSRHGYQCRWNKRVLD
ncbi:MAG: HEAT repeat domain-containing protein [Elusimicrobiota bacterium]